MYMYVRVYACIYVCMYVCMLCMYALGRNAILSRIDSSYKDVKSAMDIIHSFSQVCEYVCVCVCVCVLT